MNKIVYKLVFDRKKSLNPQGMALVQVEAYQNKQKKYFSTHIYLKPFQWDARRQQVKNHPNAETLNLLLGRILAEIEHKELTLWKQGKPVSLDRLKEEWNDKAGERSFTDFCKQEMEETDMKESTRRNLQSTLRVLHSYCPQVSFADLTFEFVADFEQYLHRKGYHMNTIAKHIKHLRRLVNRAVRKDYVEEACNPFRHYRIKTVPGRHTHLTPEELERLEQIRPLPRHHRLQHVLDAFLFCCYAGLRYSDFISLTPVNLVCIEQKQWLIYRSVKTGIEVRLPLFLLFDGKALDILKKYQGQLERFFALRDNSNANKCLRILSRMAGVDKPISFHTARHTNATLLIYRGVNITTVQKLLGHKSVRTTQIYANVMDQTVVCDLKAHR